jgi:hypothetical protein
MHPRRWGRFCGNFAFGDVRRLDAVASRLLGRWHQRTPLLAGIDGPVIIDLDDSIVEVHGYAKQGSGYGYSGVGGLNALIATLTTAGAAPVIVGQRLRKGACGSARGAARMIADTLATVARLRPAEATDKPLVRMDSAFYAGRHLVRLPVGREQVPRAAALLRHHRRGTRAVPGS